jgi:hypothetical protein
MRRIESLALMLLTLLKHGFHDKLWGMNHQSGSAFFFLFIALALFAGLSFVFLQGTQNSSAMLNQEQIKNSARQIIAYGNDVDRGAKRLLLRGCVAETMEFESANSSSPADKRCSLFHANGAGLLLMKAPNNTLSDPASAATQTVLLKIDGVGDSAKTDIVLRMTHLRPEICQQINADLLATDLTAAPPEDTFTAAQTDTNLSNGIDDTIAIALGDTAATLVGKKGFCYEDTTTNRYDFIKVLVAR